MTDEVEVLALFTLVPTTAFEGIERYVVHDDGVAVKVGVRLVVV